MMCRSEHWASACGIKACFKVHFYAIVAKENNFNYLVIILLIHK